LNVKTICLGYLSLRNATGYEIKKDCEEGLFCHFLEASYGSIYPALNQLAVEGLVTVHEEEQSGKPDKKVYAITAKGRDALRAAIGVLPTQDKYKSEFLFIMLLKDHISAEQQEAAIIQQLHYIRTDLEGIDACRTQPHAGAASDFVMGYGEVVLKAAEQYLQQKLLEMRGGTAIAAE
jgi:DNA-binding PadR family transcriptional regulator